MLGDFSIPGFKSHYSPLTSTSGPRLCERPLNLAPQGERGACAAATKPDGRRRGNAGCGGWRGSAGRNRQRGSVTNNLTNSVGTTGNPNPNPDGNSHTQTRGPEPEPSHAAGVAAGVAVMKVKLYHLQFPIPIRSGGKLHW